MSVLGFCFLLFYSFQLDFTKALYTAGWNIQVDYKNNVFMSFVSNKVSALEGYRVQVIYNMIIVTTDRYLMYMLMTLEEYVELDR